MHLDMQTWSRRSAKFHTECYNREEAWFKWPAQPTTMPRSEFFQKLLDLREFPCTTISRVYREWSKKDREWNWFLLHHSNGSEFCLNSMKSWTWAGGVMVCMHVCMYVCVIYSCDANSHYLVSHDPSEIILYAV